MAICLWLKANEDTCNFCGKGTKVQDCSCMISGLTCEHVIIMIRHCARLS